MLLALVHTSTVVCGLPNVLPIHHALWLSLVIVPILGLSFLTTPRDPAGGFFCCTWLMRMLLLDVRVGRVLGLCTLPLTVSLFPFSSPSRTQAFHLVCLVALSRHEVAHVALCSSVTRFEPLTLCSAEMTVARTPQKRVEYPELFFPPDRIVPPNVTKPKYERGREGGP